MRVAVPAACGDVNLPGGEETSSAKGLHIVPQGHRESGVLTDVSYRCSSAVRGWSLFSAPAGFSCWPWEIGLEDYPGPPLTW
jgi:hypothetical protein